MGGREKKILDRGWKFYQGHTAEQDPDFGFHKDGESKGFLLPDYDDASWRSVDLPHDWVAELGFDFDCSMDAGYKVVCGGKGHPNTIGWYRKHFPVDADENKLYRIVFDGIFRDAAIWLNGHYIDRHLGGYTGFEYDVSEYIRYGQDNVLVVRVDINQAEGWFYEGGGIYRHVWLLITEKIHIEENTVQVIAVRENADAKVVLHVCIHNEEDAESDICIAGVIKDKEGEITAEKDRGLARFGSYSKKTFKIELELKNARLWSLESPYLYQAELTVRKKDKVTDKFTMAFGIREVVFDPEHGLFLNGEPVKVKGVCCHQDFAGVGIALPDRLQYYRIKKLKEMGCNAYRCSHHAPSNELLNACDQMGMLVMDERRGFGSGPEMMRQTEELILAHRNHPSIFIWSIGNEEHTVQNTAIGEKIAKKVIRRVRELDPTRLVTYGGNNGNVFEGVNKMVDIRGWNYIRNGSVDVYHKEHPDQPIIGTEEASTLCTRGEYETNIDKGVVSARDENVPPWGETAEGWWRYYAERDFLAGGFIWTGFDYRGEPIPANKTNTLSQFGVMDLCGFPKDIYYYYKSWWTDETVLHVFPHWNVSKKVGDMVTIYVFSNCEEIELYLNKKSLGRKKMERYGHIEWNIKYEPGILGAIGFQSGEKIIEKEIRTAGKPYRIELAANRDYILNDGQDTGIVTIKIVDEKGIVVPDAEHTISFSIDEGNLIGVGNGDPTSTALEKFIGVSRSIEIKNWEKMIVEEIETDEEIQKYLKREEYIPADISILRPQHICPVAEQRITDYSTYEADPAFIRFLEDGYTKRVVWVKKPKDSKETGILYRTKLVLTEQQIKDEMYYIKFMGVRGGAATVFVNGEKTSDIKPESREYRVNVQNVLKKGENTIHVLCRHSKGKGGLTEGVYLENKEPKAWKRKVFHGLALALIQCKEGGKAPVTFCAEADGLKSGNLQIRVCNEEEKP